MNDKGTRNPKQKKTHISREGVREKDSNEREREREVEEG